MVFSTVIAVLCEMHIKCDLNKIMRGYKNLQLIQQPKFNQFKEIISVDIEHYPSIVPRMSPMMECRRLCFKLQTTDMKLAICSGQEKVSSISEASVQMVISAWNGRIGIPVLEMTDPAKASAFAEVLNESPLST